MKQQLVISALGEYRPDLMNGITSIIQESGACITDCRMDILGKEAAITIMVSGAWDSIAKLEDVLEKLVSELNLKIISRRTNKRIPDQNKIPYNIEILCSNQNHILSKVTRFLSDNEINICDLYTNTFHSPHSEQMLLAIHMTVNIPMDISISLLRSEFLDFCDRYNLDGILEPIKNT
jgi:glycine cleavage system transcriptional repressor